MIEIYFIGKSLDEKFAEVFVWTGFLFEDGIVFVFDGDYGKQFWDNFFDAVLAESCGDDGQSKVGIFFAEEAIVFAGVLVIFLYVFG